jgi:hypothetical protein
MKMANHWNRRSLVLAGWLLTFFNPWLAANLPGAIGGPSWEHPPHQQTRGVFWREHWYERGLTNANPAYERRFRINAPATSLHPQWGRRIEARENGLMLVKSEEDLFQITAAEFYAELWGGHPGTGQKRVSVNGRSTYSLPRVGTEDGHCTYSYPVVRLGLTDLVNGYNAFQWALDQGATFWGHALVDNACLRVALTNRHPGLVKLDLGDFEARVIAQSAPGEDSPEFQLSIEFPARFSSRISEVTYQGWYSGYDDNGNLRELDWHGFTLNRRPFSQLGSAADAPFQVAWDTSMLPAQRNVAVRAFVRFHDAPGLVYVTAATTGLGIEHPPGKSVLLFRSDDVPASFWSRAGRARQCTILLDVNPPQIERAELVVITWTGGAGKVKDYFKLNGRHFPVAEGSAHVIQFNRLPVEPSLLRRGANVIELLSDTEHHGIEIIYPGPALVVRYQR